MRRLRLHLLSAYGPLAIAVADEHLVHVAFKLKIRLLLALAAF